MFDHPDHDKINVLDTRYYNYMGAIVGGTTGGGANIVVGTAGNT
jgi:hypothetical protein